MTDSSLGGLGRMPDRKPGPWLEADLLDFYRRHATEVLIPFWNGALDERYGGVFTCFENSGARLLSRNKYVWSQGRFLWLLSRLSSLCSRGLLDGDSGEYLDHAGRTAGFIDANAILPNGNCAFLLSETGELLEGVPGVRHDTSLFADCFVVLGYAEYARVGGGDRFLAKALYLYDRVLARIGRGEVRTEPYPIPRGYEAHSLPMILLNTSQELAESAERFGHPRARELRDRASGYAAEIMDGFCLGDGDVVTELKPEDEALAGTLLARHRNPGHSLESMWFVLSESQKHDRDDQTRRAATVIRRAVGLGWDDDHGGLLRFVDRDGGMPKGVPTDDPYERLIRETWDTKLWWPHSEALYATLLAAEVSDDPTFYKLYNKVHDYAFGTFPNPDRSVGEWVQIRDRRGRPVEKVVALPVKDPYHVLRNVLLVIELLNEGTGTS